MFIENFKNARECIIREYEDENTDRLPDERYQLRLVYYDQKQLKALRKAYTTQLDEMYREMMHLWDVLDGIYHQHREEIEKDNWETLSDRLLNPKKQKGLFKSKKEDAQSEAEEKPSAWNEISFIQPEDTIVSKSNPTEEARIEEIASRFRLIKEKIREVFQDNGGETKHVLEARLNFLEEQFDEYTNQINPYHVQPGLLLDIDIISIKKKKTTMMNMANVINEFLAAVSRGFTDTAFADMSQTRTTERGDINQEFVSVSE